MPGPGETIGRLARRFGLSRSALLYYDRIGLLRPSRRSGAGYRRYAPADAARLETICQYRAAGVPLAEIAGLLDRPADGAAGVLGRRLRALNGEIAGLRAQQGVIVRLLGRPALRRRAGALDKAGWTALLRAAGLDEEGTWAWHREFEAWSPEGHQDFLASLCLPPAEIARIRARSRGGAGAREDERRDRGGR